MLSKKESITQSESEIDTTCENKKTIPITLNLCCRDYIECARIYTLRKRFLEKVLETQCNSYLKQTLRDIDNLL